MAKTFSNILIIRLSAIGDVVMASGLIPALKALYPEAKISWLTEPATASLLWDHPQLDEVIVWQRQEWKSLWHANKYATLYRQISGFRKQLRRAEYDLVLDTQGLLKSGIWAWFTDAQCRIGLGSKEGSQYLMTKVIPRNNEPIISSEYRGLVDYLSGEKGCSERHFHMSLNHFANTDALQLLPTALNHQEGDKPKDYVVLCPYTTRPQKHWFDHHWITLAKLIELEYSMPCIILGGPENQLPADELTKSMPNAFNLAGKCALNASNQIISQARFLVGVDTGITHMGIMHNVPTVAIFGSTCPYLQAPDAQILYLNKDCSPCKRKPTCSGRFECLEEITPDMVMKAVQNLLATNSRACQ